MSSKAQNTLAIKSFLELIVRPNGLAEAVAWPNKDFTPPKTDKAENVWMRFTHLEGLRRRITVSAEPGQTLRRSTGSILIQIFQPRNTGEAEVRRIADLIIAAYEDNNFEGLRFGTIQHEAVGTSGQWFHYQVTMPYTYDICS